MLGCSAMRFIATCAFGLAVFVGRAAAELPQIKIGVICPLSGPLSNVGTTIKNSVARADADFDKNGGVEFLIEDDQFQPKSTVTAAQKLIELDKVAGLITFGSTTSLSVADIAQEHRVPLVAIAMSEKLTENRPFVFRHVTEPPTQISLIAAEIRRRAYESIGIVTSLQDAMLALREALLKEAPGNIVVNEEVLPSETDLKAIATKIRMKNPAAVFLAVLPPQLSLLSKELRRNGYRGQLFSGIQGQNKHEVEAAAGALSGLIFASPDDSAAADYYQLYEASYGQHAIADAAEAYDVAALFIAASRSDDMRAHLAAVRNFTGIFGTYSVNEKRTFSLPGVLKQVNAAGSFEFLR